MLYVFQHLSNFERAACGFVETAIGIVAFMLLSQEKFLNGVIRHLTAIQICAMLLALISRGLLVVSPLAHCLLINVKFKLVEQLSITAMNDLVNRLFSGRELSMLRIRLQRNQMVGALTGNGIALIGSDLPIEYIVWSSLILCLISYPAEIYIAKFVKEVAEQNNK